MKLMIEIRRQFSTLNVAGTSSFISVTGYERLAIVGWTPERLAPLLRTAARVQSHRAGPFAC